MGTSAPDRKYVADDYVAPDYMLYSVLGAGAAIALFNGTAAGFATVAGVGRDANAAEYEPNTAENRWTVAARRRAALAAGLDRWWVAEDLERLEVAAPMDRAWVERKKTRYFHA